MTTVMATVMATVMMQATMINCVEPVGMIHEHNHQHKQCS